MWVLNVENSMRGNLLDDLKKKKFLTNQLDVATFFFLFFTIKKLELVFFGSASGYSLKLCFKSWFMKIYFYYIFKLFWCIDIKYNFLKLKNILKIIIITLSNITSYHIT